MKWKTGFRRIVVALAAAVIEPMSPAPPPPPPQPKCMFSWEQQLSGKLQNLNLFKELLIGAIVGCGGSVG